MSSILSKDLSAKYRTDNLPVISAVDFNGSNLLNVIDSH